MIMPNTYDVGQRLRIRSDRFEKLGIRKGTIVHVLELHGDGEVEIRGEDGRTLDWFGAYDVDLEPA
jgi:hypothetical protein